MRKRLIIGCLVLLVTAFAGGWAVYRFAPQFDEQRHVDAAASAYDKDKLMMKGDYMRLTRLQKSSAATGKITDVDFAWLMQVMDKTFQSRDPRMPLVRAKLAACFVDAHQFSPSQKESLFRLSQRLLSTSPETSVEQGNFTVVDKAMAFAIVRRQQEKRMVPYVLPYVTSSNKDLRIGSYAALLKCGVTKSQVKVIVDKYKAEHPGAS